MRTGRIVIGVVMKAVYWSTGLALVLCSAGMGYFWGTKNTGNDATLATTSDSSANKILYYRNPMGLPDTSPTPKQDSMGMDYLPVYEHDAANKSTNDSDLVQVGSRKVQLLGVQTHTVKEQTIGREIRALGTVQIDETRAAIISPNFKGTITKLLVNTTGQKVQQGEILFEARVPGLFLAELTYRQAVKRVVNTATASSEVKRAANIDMGTAMEELDELGITHDEMQRLQQGGDPFHQLYFRSPVSGVVMQKNIVEGSRFLAGRELYQVADLSNLWLMIQLPEQELAHIKVGDEVRATFIATPDKIHTSTVEFIYPALNENNRSIQLRASVDNSNGQLKPGQTAEVWLRTKQRKALTIPPNALMDSGHKQWILLAKGDGAFQPHKVTVGERHLDWVEISGLCVDDEVVTNANFLIDSESSLQAALANFAMEH
jgi:membrane fusion protein, copper/silver efflux system